jgi:hypothetical protein
MTDANQLARPAVERLSEDESLRGELSDIGFGPLLDWAVAAVKAYAAKAADSAAMDSFTDRVRGVVQSVVEAAQDSELADPAPMLDFDPADPQKAAAALKNLHLGGDPDDNAVQIAAVLQSALAGAPAASPPTPGPSEAALTETEKPAEAIPAETPQPAGATPAETKESAEKTTEVNPPAGETPKPSPEAAAKTVSSALEAAGNLANSILGAIKPTPAEAPLPAPEPEPPTKPEPAPSESGPAAPQPGAVSDSLKSTVSRTSNSSRGLSRGKRRRRKR